MYISILTTAEPVLFNVCLFSVFQSFFSTSFTSSLDLSTSGSVFCFAPVIPTIVLRSAICVAANIVIDICFASVGVRECGSSRTFIWTKIGQRIDAHFIPYFILHRARHVYHSLSLTIWQYTATSFHFNMPLKHCFYQFVPSFVNVLPSLAFLFKFFQCTGCHWPIAPCRCVNLHI